ncbi:PAS domain S-box protein [Methanoregula sp.]|uniref:PAS domain S-box protein n=1 Tax=Methanoregula sp. TaxID=2052170 RepID=UPI003567491D
MPECEERYRTILRTALDGFCIIDRSGRFIEVNDTLCKMLGYTREEMQSRSLHQIETKLTPNQITERIQEITRTGSDRFETQYRCRDRNLIDVEVSVVYSDKIQGGLVLFLRDITERKNAEKALRETNTAFSQAQELAHVGSWHYDLRQNVITWSDELYRIFGYRPGGIVLDLEKIRERIHPDDLDKHDRILAAAAETHVYEPGEYRIIHPDGTMGYISTKGFATVDENSEVTHLMGVVQDITERKFAEENILLANRNLALMTDITYQDIQNKVTALRGYVELMKKSGTGQERVSFLPAMSEILETIHHLITNTKDYLRMGADQSRWINLEQIIQKEASVLAGNKEITLSVRLDAIEIWSDPLIGRVFQNLLDNAVRHGRTVTGISFGYQEIPEGLLLICNDDGSGIPEEEKAHIFERVVAGEGRFGLFFAHEFLSASGMAIRETGEAGTGARFEITVPKRMYRFAGTAAQ